MRVRGQLFGVSCAVAALLVLCSAVALAKEPTAAEKKAATDGFKSCHEQEAYGDATACWRVWFDKYEHTGSEAEVLFAQERMKRAGVAPKAAPAAKPADAKPGTPTPAPTPTPTPAPPAEAAAPPESTDVAAAILPAAAGASTAALMVSGPNLCEQKPNANSPSTRKRIIVFAPAGADSIESDAGIKRVGGAQLIREVFLQRFPLDRFNNLLTTLSGQAGWEAKASLSKEEIEQYIASATAGADPSIASQLTQALECADYLVFPAITAHTLKPMPAGKGAALELGLEGKLGIFKVSATGFQLVTTLSESVPGLMDRAQDAAAVQAAKAMSSVTASANGAMAQANKAADQANNVANQAKNAANQAQNAAQSAADAASNLASGQLPGALGTGGTNAPATGGTSDSPGLVSMPALKNPLGDLHERMSDACTKAKTPDENLVCEVRVRAYQLSWHFRDDAQSVEGWQLVSPLLFNAAGNPAVSLGSEERLKVGDAFVANGPAGERLGYFKVVHVGPGGKDGQSQPSELSLRLGAATEGMQLREYRVWGLELSAHGSVETLLLNSEHDLAVGAGRAVYKFPSLVAGGGGSLGYDLSGLFSMSETRVRLRAEYLAGAGTGLNVAIMPFDLSFEKGFHLGKGLNFFLGLGPTLSLVTVKVAPPVALAGFGSYELSAKRFGGELDTGFDILFSPRVALRFAGIFRYNVGRSYTATGVGAVDLSADGTTDSFSTLGLNVGLNLTL